MTRDRAYAIATVAMLLVLGAVSVVAWQNTYRISPSSQTHPGEWALFLLQGGEYRTLDIEMDWAKNCEPNSSARADFRTVVAGIVDKPGGVSLSVSNEIAQSEAGYSYNISEIDGIEARNRNSLPDPHAGKISVYIVYLNGWYRNNDGHLMKKVLGVSYRAGSIAVFREAVWAADPPQSAWQKEEAVLVHEFGHLAGLVNIVQKSAVDHEHSALEMKNGAYVREYDNHCNDTLCVMYIEITRVPGGGGAIPVAYAHNFCDNCTGDVAALKGASSTRLTLRFAFLAVAVASFALAAAYAAYTAFGRKKVPPADNPTPEGASGPQVANAPAVSPGHDDK